MGILSWFSSTPFSDLSCLPPHSPIHRSPFTPVYYSSTSGGPSRRPDGIAPCSKLHRRSNPAIRPVGFGSNTSTKESKIILSGEEPFSTNSFVDIVHLTRQYVNRPMLSIHLARLQAQLDSMPQPVDPATSAFDRRENVKSGI